MNIIKWFFFAGLGIIMGSFGVVQLLILILYSLPTNKALKVNAYTRDFNKMMKKDKVSILIIGLITLLVSILVYRFASSVNWAIYVWAIIVIVIIGRKQLKGNDNNITDYIKSHQRFLIDIDELDNERLNRFLIILKGKYIIDKNGLGGLLLLYVGAVSYYTYRSGYSVIGSMKILSDPVTIRYVTELDSRIIPFTIIQIILTIGIVSMGAFVLFSIIKKNKNIRVIVRNYHMLLIAISIIILFLASLIPSTLENENIYLHVIEIVITILFAVWGINYFKVSQRVNNTFFGLRNSLSEIDSQEEIDHYHILEHVLEKKNIQEISKEEEKLIFDKRKRAARFVSGFFMGLMLISITIWYGVNHTSVGKYLNANVLYQLGKYDDAVIVYSKLGSYKDSDVHIRTIKYNKAFDLFEEGRLEESLHIFEELDSHKESKEYIHKISINLGKKYIDDGNFSEAVTYFEKLEYIKQQPYVRSYIDEAYTGLCENLINEKDFKKAREILESKLFRISQESPLADRIKSIKVSLEDYDFSQLYIEAVKDFKSGSFSSAEKKFIEITGFDKYDNYSFTNLNEYMDSRRYMILLKVIMLHLQYAGSDIMKDYIMMTDNRLENLYEAATTIAGFETINEYLDSSIFNPVRLQGRFLSDNLYFEYIKHGNFDSEVKYNIPWYSGKYFRLIDNATIMQNGDNNTWNNVFRFSYESDNIIQVYSYKDGRVYSLYRKH